MLTSGTTAVATSSAANATLISNTIKFGCNCLRILNEGGVAGFFSVDGGTTWGRIAATGWTDCRERFSGDVVIKRDGSTDVTGIWAFASNLDVRG